MKTFVPLYEEKSNGDENLQETGIGNFHKTVRRASISSGRVDPAAFGKFLVQTRSAVPDYSSVPRGDDSSTVAPAPFVNPQASLSRESLGPDPLLMTMPPAPRVSSADTAAEMVELYYMALLRDVPFDQWNGSATVNRALAAVDNAYSMALSQQNPAQSHESGVLPIVDDGRIRLGLDLPGTPSGDLDLQLNTLFRSGLPGEEHGPLVSQFFMHDVPFGTQVIEQLQYPYAPHRDYLTTFNSWRYSQTYGKSILTQNSYPDAQSLVNSAAFESPRLLKRIRTMRDLARFVHKDALHQAYFNAALLLLNWKAQFDSGNPYSVPPTSKDQTGFATFGPPHLLTLVSEVASRALKVVWHQKWHVHLRLRPEAYGGILQEALGAGVDQPPLMHFHNFDSNMALLEEIKNHNQQFGVTIEGDTSARNTVLLPMAFESGSPVHPAYGAGHATVAGACVTILKAWFDESISMNTLMAQSRPYHPVKWAEEVKMVQPGDAFNPRPLSPAESNGMTVGGELNKLASNVAMGRSMGGVHWRTDNTRSLRLGEQIATIILRRQSRDYAEMTPSWTYTSFDNHKVIIHPNGRVHVENNPTLERFYNQTAFAPAH